VLSAELRSELLNPQSLVLSPMKETTRVAALADIPAGTMRYVEVDGLPIALANVGGTIYAFGDACRHEGGPLSAGVLIDDTVTCPWHGWTYSVRSGKAIVPPVGIRVPTYAVRIEGDDVYVTIDWPDG
jgi:nitrite reductase/ring-hydroxylating ferredoxin subunit